MGYLISQIVACLLIAGIVGAVIGYLFKQIVGAKVIHQVEGMWSDKVRLLTRDLDALRVDAKVQVQRAQEAERASTDIAGQLASATKELASTKENVSAVQADLNSKVSTLAALEVTNTHWKVQLEAAAKNAADLESAIAGKDSSLQNLESQLAGSVKVSGAKDLHIQTLAAEIAELAPLKDQLATAHKAIGEWEARYKSLEKTKNAELAGLKARIRELEPLTSKVKDWESRYGGMLNEKDAALAKLTATVAALEPLREKVAAAAKENETLSAKVQALEATLASSEAGGKQYLSQIDELRESLRHFEAAEVEHEALVNGLRARVADIEPLEMKLHAAGEELGGLRLHAAGLEHSSKTSAVEHDTLVTGLRARIADIEPGERKLRAALEQIGKLEQTLADSARVKDAEEKLVTSLRARVADLEPLQLKLHDSVKENEALRLRVGMLESSLTHAAAEHEALTNSLRARVADIEPLEEKLRTSGEESAVLRLRVQELEPELGFTSNQRDTLLARLADLEELLKHSAEASAKHQTLITSLRARVADIEPLEQKLHRSSEEVNALRQRVQELEPLLNGAASEREALLASSAGQATLVTSLRAQLADLEPLKARLEATAQERHRLEESLRNSLAAAAEHETLVRHLRARIADIEPLEHRLHAAGGEVVKLQSRLNELDPLQAELAQINEENEARHRRIQSLERSETEHMAKIHKLEESLKRSVALEAHDQVQTSEDVAEITRLKARVAELETLRGQIQTWDRRFSSTVNEKDGEITRLQFELMPMRDEVIVLNSRIQALTAENEQLRGRLQQAVAVTGGAATAPATDDLRLIWGIGPVLEKRLNEYGISTFRQIALWTKQDIIDFETHLPAFKNRVERDQWVAGAREEHLKKYGEAF